MPAGQIIGRVSVKVLPDTDDFKRRAKNDLERIERQLKVRIPTEIDTTGAERELLSKIREINARNRSQDSRKIKLYAKIDRSAGYMREEINKARDRIDKLGRTNRPTLKLDVVAGELRADLDQDSLKHVEDQLKDWRDKVSPLKVDVRPNLVVGSTTWVEKRLDYLCRPRSIPIIPRLNSGAAAKVSAGIATMIGAASGGRVLNDFLDTLWRSFKNLDKSAPLIGTIGLAIAGLASIGITAVSNLAALSYTLAQIGAVAMTMPATLAAAGIGIGILIAAFKDFNTVLPEVKAKLSELQNLISSNFWAKAEAPIRGLINGLLPQFSEGLGRASTALGSFFGTFATALKGSLDGQLKGMFDGLVTGVQNAEKSATPLAAAITTLGTIGAQYLPQMGTWVANIAAKFNDWLTASVASGAMFDWIEAGKQALSDLGRVLSNLGGIFAGIGRAAAEGGGSTLGVFADTLERIHEIVDSPVFQGGLAASFAAAHKAIAAITEGAGPAFSDFMGTLPELLNAVLPVAGQAIGTIVSALSTALANPAFQAGLTNLFEGLADALAKMAPAFGPIGAALGALGTSLSVFLTALGPTMGTVLTALADALLALLPALNPVLAVLGGALGGIIQALVPAFMVLVGAVSALMPPIVQMVNALMSGLMPVIQMLAPMLATLLADALSQIGPLFPMIGQAIASILPLFGQLVAAILPLVMAVLPPLVAIFSALIPVLVQIISAVLPPLIAAITALVPAITPILSFIGQLVAMLLTVLAPVLTFIAEVLVSVVTGIINGFTNLFGGLTGIFEGFRTMFSGGWSNFLNGLWQVVVGVWNVIKGVFEIALNVGILGVVRKGWQLIKGIFTSSGGWLKGLVTGLWGSIKSLFSNGISGAYGFVVSGIGRIKSFFSSGVNGMKSVASTAWTNVKTAFSTGISNAVTTVRELPGRIKSGLGSLAGTLKGAAAELIGGFVAGIQAKFGDVKAKLGELTKKLTDWKGPAPLDRVILTPAGRMVIDGFINGLESRYDAVRKSLRGLTDDVAATDFAPLSIPSISGSLSAFDPAMAGETGVFGAGTQIDLDINTNSNANPEEIADELLWTLRRIGSGGVYATRKGA